MTEELENQYAQWAESYASDNGWVLNPDSRQRAAVLKGLARNTVKFGYAYCPCRIRSGNPKEDEKIICPCDFHRDELDQAGHCTCYFFFDKEA